MITDADVKDGGVYTCLLEVLVRGAANFNVTDYAMVTGELPYYLKHVWPSLIPQDEAIPEAYLKGFNDNNNNYNNNNNFICTQHITIQVNDMN